MSRMHLTIIGSGTGVPSAGRGSPCLLLDAASVRMLLDTGPGSLRSLARQGVSVFDIHALYYSHLHIDHTADFIPFVFATKYSPGRVRTEPLTIIGPPALRRLYERLVDSYGSWARAEGFPVEWIETETGTHRLGPLTITTCPVQHAPESIAVRIEDASGTVVVYSGDTQYCPAMVEIARTADIAVLECSFPDNLQKDGHLTPGLAGTIARQAGCKKLVLTHLYPPCDVCDVRAAAAREFSGPIVMARDGLQIAV